MSVAIPCQFLEWDSQFFGKRIGSVLGHRTDDDHMQAVLEWASDNRMDCLYFLADPTHPHTIRTAEVNGFYFQSVKTILERKLSGLDAIALPPMEGLTIRFAQAEDLEALRPVARHAYDKTRFYNDPCFPSDKCEEMYDIWLTKSITKELADVTIVAELNGVPTGYASCQVGKAPNVTEGTLQLIGVNEENRGARIGQRVMYGVMEWLAEQGMTTISLATQGHNVPAIRFYERLGFTTRLIQFWYHKWFNDCDSE